MRQQQFSSVADKDVVWCSAICSGSEKAVKTVFGYVEKDSGVERIEEVLECVTGEQTLRDEFQGKLVANSGVWQTFAVEYDHTPSYLL